MYNKYRAHPRARSVIERAWGLYKNRFQCARLQLRLKSPNNSGRVLLACAILHNFLIRTKEIDDFDFYPEEHEEVNEEEMNDEELEVEETSAQNNRLVLMNNLFKEINGMA